jgi:lysophospholipase L1-like esterase
MFRGRKPWTRLSRWWLSAPRQRTALQCRFAFAETAAQRERWFKRAILALTLSACGALLGGTPTGRFLASRAVTLAHAVALHAVGGEVGREAIDSDWRERRRRGIAATQGLLARVYRESPAPVQAMLRAAGMAPDDRVLRWGNFDGVLLLSSRVFAPDDTGRSYRLRPGVRSVWLRNIVLPRGMSGFFLVPTTPQVRAAAGACGAVEIPGSLQTTNSWGCRGPEPDPNADLRGVVLGDSFMQGLLVGDDETPPARLESYLREATGRSASVLNTGHLGYSPEQYDSALREYADRFRPHFVVLSICGNDFGGEDWAESCYWLRRIWQFCRSRNLVCLTVPVSDHRQVAASRRIGAFQGRLAEIAESVSYEYFDPTENLVDEHLRLVNAGLRRGRVERSQPLYNAHLDDGHFSPEGAEVWGRAVGRRLLLVLERQRAQLAPLPIAAE